jgi:hypothetical protein
MRRQQTLDANDQESCEVIMNSPRVSVDFQNADVRGRVRLNCTGTVRDLARQQVHLRDGIRLTLYSEDGDANGEPCELQTEGVVQFSVDEQGWVAVIDWDDLRHVAIESPNGRVPSGPTS